MAAGRDGSARPRSLRKPSLPWSSASLRHLIWIQSRQPSVCALCKHQPPRRLAAAGPLCPHECNADSSQPSAASLLPQLNDTLPFYYSSHPWPVFFPLYFHLNNRRSSSFYIKFISINIYLHMNAESWARDQHFGTGLQLCFRLNTLVLMQS